MKNDPTKVLSLAKADLACYAIALWPSFELAAHHRIIVDRLEAVQRGEIRRLMIFMPPRHGKSLLTSQFFPAWYLGRHPDRSIITASYGQELADDFGRKVRNLVGDPMHRAIFPSFRLADDSTSMRRFNTTRGGSYYAVGTGGPITGRGADLFVIDDPIKGPDEAQSETVRRSLYEWFQMVACTRLQPRAGVVLVQTRWHEDDLAGRLLREHPELWDVLCLAAIAETDESFRRAGEALWSQRFSLEDLEQTRVEIGSAAFKSLYQQMPAAAEGAIFRRAWWRFYREAPACGRIVQSWDTGFKTGCNNDFSVCSTWRVSETGYFLLWLWRGKVEFPELKRRVHWLAEQWKPNLILVEDRASGQSLVQELRHGSCLPIIPVKVDKDKEARAKAVTPLIEAGKVFLPESAPWLTEYIDELSSFPTGTHDDAVDSTTLALHYLRHQPVIEVQFSTVYL
ncbi:MAG: phage terminase large subunit [Acidobacteriia bacterium]|nr:phage terminase large subunit [Terriglobia bacterium]